ncbi:MAG TPA: GTP-binding protein, partial [Gemmatimonadaceae bacterium]|nr:GTP-binding protein [Gemmatimonadaceae bacterium]
MVDGLPGAGKSAVLQHALRTANGHRVVAVVRSLEPLLQQDATDVKRDGAVAVWPNGAMCIATDDATTTLGVLARRDQLPDHVLVEADGGSNARRLGGYGYMTGYRPDGLVTVVDASRAAEHDRNPQVADAWMTSLRLADLILLNKTDIAGREATSTAQRMIGSFAQTARFVWCTGGRIALPLLIGAANLRSPDDRLVVADWQPDFPASRDAETRSLLGEHCRCWCLLAEQALEAREFRRWVTRMPPFILRAAGTVHLAHEPDRRHEFSLIGMRWSL